MTKYTPLSVNDILPLHDFEKKRSVLRQRIITIKLPRRVMVGPDIIFYFENRETVTWQIQEMLFIEKGGMAQLDDDLRVYNSLVPKGNELVATMMIEIDDMDRRRMILGQLGAIEKYVSIAFENQVISATPEEDVERTNASGKTSAVHFFHFSFSDVQKELFKKAEIVVLSVAHPRYTYSTVLNKETKKILEEDL